MLSESRDVDLILSFMKGDGIVRRCMGGFNYEGINLRAAVEGTPGRFLIAMEDSVPLGFIVLNEERSGEFSIHLCLKTIGKKTREFFALALDYAKRLGARAILAEYPSSYRAATKLADEFGFIDSIQRFEPPVPYRFQKLFLTPQ